jgi:hydroxyacylglutathione hydrolase
MTHLTIEQIAVLSDNYIHLLHEPESGATAVVDPAVAAPVLEILAAKGWGLTHILCTHHHGDHTGGNLDLKKATGARVVGARKDAERIPGIDLEVGEGDTFLLGHAAAMVFETPGHTSGHIAFWFPEQAALFCGDTLFSLGCGRLFEGSPEQMWDSLAKLRELPDHTKIYCAHEYTAANGRFAKVLDRDNPALKARIEQVARLNAQGRSSIPTTMEDERATNPFLRADRADIAQAVGLAPGTLPAQVFAELRRRRDVF